ncbi:hypothetical protein SteCoe_924 [Stentor coeruleus]|uniref:Uncharacterized protein n=1 Tax=Stentor coeruleus TaxID=5963 RepID=A0A1R2D329_9CILI|nr:hypothetical protein SteCoe_924 [Stentor coeruleus]
MCNFNPHCHELDGRCKCNQASAIKNNTAYTYPGYSLHPSALLYLINSVANRNSILDEVLADARELYQKLSSNQAAISPVLNTPATVSSFSTTSKEALLFHLYGGNPTFYYTLSLCNDIPMPAYKDRCFTVFARILDSNNNYASLITPTTFKLQMYTQENPPKLIETNTSGNLAIRGNIKVESTSIIMLKKVVVNEVTSHFRNGSVFFVILPEGNQSIRPLIIENFVVRARKPDVGKLEKRVKSVEDKE